MAKVSVIMPVYNSENYLAKAIESVLDQTFSDLELILVNDASKDSSGKICNHYKSKDTRVRVVHLENNLGICGARNKGLDIAIGEYIAFCDDDDFYAPQLVGDNYLLAKENNADIVKFGKKLIDVLENGEVIREKDSKIPKLIILQDEIIKKKFFDIKSLGVLTNVWNGLYKKDMLIKNHIKFDESMKFGSEDTDFSLRCYLKSNNIVINPDICYTHYRRNSSSTSRKFNMNKIYSIIKTAETEQSVWRSLENNEENKISIICAANNYLINIILIQLFHKDCNMNFKEKLKFIASLKEHQQFSYELDTRIMQKLLREKPKQAIFSALFNAKRYKSLLFVMNLYNKVLGEKW
jgi:glycosyltransferase involved in cell wall biosynthesis